MSAGNPNINEEPWSEQLLKSKLGSCAGPCGDSALNWLMFGALAYPYLIKHGLQRYVYLEFHTRCLIAAFCSVGTSFFMGYRSKMKCEENIKRLYAEQKEKELEKLKKDSREKGTLKKEAN